MEGEESQKLREQPTKLLWGISSIITGNTVLAQCFLGESVTSPSACCSLYPVCYCCTATYNINTFFTEALSLLIEKFHEHEWWLVASQSAPESFDWQLVEITRSCMGWRLHKWVPANYWGAGKLSSASLHRFWRHLDAHKLLFLTTCLLYACMHACVFV